jgi:predicted transposase YbfD/YdcC
MAEFGRAKSKWFKNFLELPNGIPSPDTFNRVFAALNPVEFERCFLLWAEGLRESLGGQIVYVDGKTLRGAHDLASGKTPLNLVSAWVGANRLLLGQIKVQDGSNEITAIPPLLKLLALNNCTVTIAAIGTRKEIAGEIRNQGADYVLALKANQGLFYEGVVESFKEGLTTNFKDMAHGYYETVDKDHGRIETRRYWTISDADYLKYFDPKGEWRDLKSVAMVEAERIIRGEATRERRYYISSLGGKAQALCKAIRSHWGIETSLYWVLDVAFKEDHSRVRKGYGAENLAALRRLALNLIQRETTFRKSVKGRQLKACWDINYLMKLLMIS